MENSSDKNIKKEKIGRGHPGIKEFASKGGKARLGIKHKTTMAREQMLEHLKQTISDRAKKLIDIQTVLANGAIKVFKTTYHFEGDGKNRKKVANKPVLVEDTEELSNVLDYEFCEGENPSDDMQYFFVMTKEPDNNAINSLLDRAFGKATELKKVGLTFEDIDDDVKSLATQALSQYVKGKKK